MKGIFKVGKSLTLDNILNDRLVWTYTVVVVLYQFLYQIMPVRDMIYKLGLNIVSALLAIIGLGLLLLDFLTQRYFLKTKFILPLLILIAIMLISALCRVQYGLTNNVKTIIWQTVQMLVIFPLFTRFSQKQLFGMLRFIFHTFSVFAVPAVLVSFFQYYTRMHYTILIDGSELNQGLSGGRLFGIFGGMHFAVLILVSMAILAVDFGIRASKTWQKIAYFCLTALYIVYSVATGTRSTIIAVLCAVLPTGYFVLKRMFQKSGIGTSLRRVICWGGGIVAVLTVCVVLLGTVRLLEVSNVVFYNAFVVSKEDHLQARKSDTVQEIGVELQPQEGEVQPQPIVSDEELIRPDVGSEDISNNRFTIWREYLNIVFADPLSIGLGFSPGEYQNYIIHAYPDNYIVQHIREQLPSMFQRGYIYDTHNAFISALAMTGVAGTLVLVLFLLWGFVTLLKSLSENQSVEMLTLLFILIYILTMSFFDSDLFFRCTSSSVLFWLVSGAALKLAQEGRNTSGGGIENGGHSDSLVSG